MKNVIITGASSGLGLETAKKIAMDKNIRIIMASRNPEKAEAAKKEIIAHSGNENIVFMLLDTSSLASVKGFAEKFISEYDSLDVLINNAGISGMRGKGLTPEGFEMCFATNYLGHFLLTNLLLDHLTPAGRIINVTSDMHNPPGGISWKGMDYIKTASEDRQKYSFSKLCMICFTHGLAGILKEKNSGITVNSFNPGFMATTDFAGGQITEERVRIVKTTMPERYGELGTSSTALAKIAVNDEFEKMSGLYFDRSTNITRSSELSYDPEIENEVWEKSKEYVMNACE